MDYDEILALLRTYANANNVAGMARYGINPQNTLGVPVKILRQIAKPIKKDHPLALQLWASGIHEARILASLVADPRQVDEALMESWVQDFDSWDVCDLTCNNLLGFSTLAHSKALEWCERQPEFVRRAGFVLMAVRAVHDKKAPDADFLLYLEKIKAHADDERNFVKKAVNWALRQIGKRNPRIQQHAIETAQQIQQTNSKAARWVAADALRELQSARIRNH
jgi:3-methyladenine DNA glycosylase AlkD